MSVFSGLKQEAEQFALSMQVRLGDLDREIKAKTVERSLLIEERNTARLAVQRYEKYPVTHGAKILCPYCWVGHGRLSTLAIDDDADPEVLRCDSCDTELETGSLQAPHAQDYSA